MPLPVVFKFLTDMSGARFDLVSEGMDDIRISSNKASSAVKTLFSGIASGQDPISTLTNSLSMLTRNLGAIGIGIAAAAGAIGYFAKESKAAKEAADKLNNAVEGFQANSSTLDLGGAISQFQNLTKTIKDVEAEANKPGLLDRIGQGIVGFFGGNKEQLEFARQNSAITKKQAEFAIQTQLANEASLMALSRTNKGEVERLRLAQKQRQEREEYLKLGVSEQTLAELKKKQDQEFLDLAKKQSEEEATLEQKKSDEAKKAEEERLRAIEKEAQAKEKAFLEEMRQADQIKKKREDLIQTGREAQGTILDRLRGAAERFGLGKVVSQIDLERQKQQRETDVALLGRAGIDPTKMQGFRPNEMITQFAQTEGELQREADTRLFESVETMKGLLKETLQVIIDRLGVPVLRSAS